MLGELLDHRYRVLKSLAKGGFGQTYIAEDTRRPGNPKCVVKHLTPASSDRLFLDNARRLFHAEAITLEQLGNHSQIPRLLAYFEDQGEFYLVQEFIDGHPLAKELQPGQKWPGARISRFLYEVLTILLFVHERGVIHRDIKPDNLLRRHHDNTLFLVDFGSVKQIRDPSVLPQQREISRTIAIGTVGYMATEQSRGRPRPNSDIYSLGIVGIQAATGMHPDQLQEDLNTGELIWESSASHISPELAAILTKMVCYHFKERYDSAQSVLTDLEPLLSADPSVVSSAPMVAEPPLPALITPNSAPGPSTPVPPTTVSHIPKTSAELSDIVQPLQPTAISDLIDLPSEPSVESTPSQEKTPRKAQADISRAESSAPAQAAFTAMSLSQVETTEPERSPTNSADANASPLPSPVQTPEADPAPKPETNPEATPEAIPELKPAKATPRLHRWYGYGAAGIGLLLAIAIPGLMSWHSRRQAFRLAQNTLETAATYQGAGQHDQCQTTAATVSEQYEMLYQQAQDLIGSCILDEAETLATGSQYQQAIALTATIPPNTEAATLAPAKAETWSNNILETAKTKYREKNVDEAITIASAVPTASPIYDKTQTLIGAWQTEQDALNNAQDALAAQQWEEAIRQAQSIPDSSPFTADAESLIATAQAAIRRAQAPAPGPSPAPSRSAPPQRSASPSPAPRATPQPTPRPSPSPGGGNIRDF